MERCSKHQGKDKEDETSTRRSRTEKFGIGNSEHKKEHEGKKLRKKRVYIKTLF